MRTIFLEIFNYLCDALKKYSPLKYTLSMLDITNHIIEATHYWSCNIVDIENEVKELNYISNIIQSIMEGQPICSQNIQYIKTYFMYIHNKFKYEHDNRRGWRYMYPELYSDVYEIEEDIMYSLRELLSLMEMSPFELFEIMTLSEKISLKNVCLELNLPYDIQRYVSKFIGF